MDNPEPPSPSFAEIAAALPAVAEAEDLLRQIPPLLQQLRLAERALLALALDGIPEHAQEAVADWGCRRFGRSGRAKCAGALGYGQGWPPSCLDSVGAAPGRRDGGR